MIPSSAQAKIPSRLWTVIWVEAWRGEVRTGLPQEFGHPQVLDQDGVHPQVRGQGPGLGGGVQLPVKEEGVQGEVDLHPRRWQ